MPSLKADKKELLIMAGLLIMAIAMWGLYAVLGTPRASNESGGIYAEIICDGEVVEKAELGKDRIFSIPARPNVVFEIKSRKIAFVQSDCPDKTCIHSGWAETSGQLLACLPNKLLLRIVDEGGVDAVAR